MGKTQGSGSTKVEVRSKVPEERDEEEKWERSSEEDGNT